VTLPVEIVFHPPQKPFVASHCGVDQCAEPDPRLLVLPVALTLAQAYIAALVRTPIFIMSCSTP